MGLVSVTYQWRRRWAGNVARMGKMRSANLKGRDHSEDLGVDAKKILEWMLGK